MSRNPEHFTDHYLKAVVNDGGPAAPVAAGLLILPESHRQDAFERAVATVGHYPGAIRLQIDQIISEHAVTTTWPLS